MRVHIATDHAAFELKNYLVEKLREAEYEVVDHGADTYDALDDYPELVIPCAEAVASEGAIGIVLGGSGNGEQIAANKVKGIRAALAYNADIARLAREHNDANMLSLGERLVSEDAALEIVRTWLETAFEGGRHVRRIELIDSLGREPVAQE